MVYSHDPELEEAILAARARMGQGGPLLVLGAVGTGKTHLVETLHRDLFPSKPLIFQEAAGLDAARFVSQVFGHVRGAFSGAVRDFAGLVGAAHGGTLCLEGIDEARREDQARLLRFLQTRGYRPLGAVEERAWQGTLVFTTRTAPATALREGLLREDFYYRIGSHVLVLPELRDRTADFLPMCRDLVSRIETELDLALRRPSTAELEGLHGTPIAGNLHGLRNLIQRAMIQGVAPASLIGAEQEAPEDHALPDTGTLEGDLAVLEARLLRRALHARPTDRRALAEDLGISRRTLMYKLKAHGLTGKRGD